MKIKQLSAIVSVIIMLFTLTAMFTGCSEKATDYSKYTYDQFKDEKWDEKEISYQFTTFDASVDEKTLSYFPCVMNLYKDGSVAIYEFWPFKELKDETLVTYTDKSRNLSYVYYGFWSSEEKEGVTTITTNYVCSDNTAVSKDALMDDMNGWITTIYDDSAATGTFVRTGGTVPPILTQDSQKTNTEAVEWIKFTSNVRK